MAEKKDFTKLRAFVEAALTNPRHPVYQAGLTHSPVLQHYAINVMMMETVKPDDWFAQYPQHVAKLEAVMAECEKADAPAAQPAGAAAVTESADVTALKSQITALAERLTKLEQPPADGTDAAE